MKFLLPILLLILLCSCSSNPELDQKINGHILINNNGECFYLRHHVGDTYFIHQIQCDELNNRIKNKENK